MSVLFTQEIVSEIFQRWRKRPKNEGVGKGDIDIERRIVTQDVKKRPRKTGKKNNGC